jgi:hypothetical protein
MPVLPRHNKLELKQHSYKSPEHILQANRDLSVTATRAVRAKRKKSQTAIAGSASFYAGHQATTASD